MHRGMEHGNEVSDLIFSGRNETCTELTVFFSAAGFSSRLRRWYDDSLFRSYYYVLSTYM